MWGTVFVLTRHNSDTAFVASTALRGSAVLLVRVGNATATITDCYFLLHSSGVEVVRSADSPGSSLALVNAIFCENGVPDFGCPPDPPVSFPLSVIGLNSVSAFTCQSFAPQLPCRYQLPSSGLVFNCSFAGLPPAVQSCSLTPAQVDAAALAPSTGSARSLVGSLTVSGPTVVAALVLRPFSVLLVSSASSSLTAGGTVTIMPNATVNVASSVGPGRYVILTSRSALVGSSALRWAAAPRRAPPPPCRAWARAYC